MIQFPTQTTLGSVKKKYCEDMRIPLSDVVDVMYSCRDPVTRDCTFYIETKLGLKPYVYTRRDLSGYSYNLSLYIPKSDYLLLRNNPLPSFIAGWVNRHTNVDLNGEDIVKVLVTKAHVDVIVAPDSMRFKNNFRLAFI